MRAVWVNEEGGVTFRVGDGVEFIKVANGGTARFTDEACRLRWAASYAAVPQVLGVGLDQTPDGDWAWLRTAGLRRARLGEPPPVDQLVVCHGDACSPNTVIDDDGRCCGHVDFGSLGAADRWADLAIATLSLGWNYPSRAWDAELFAAYGVEPDLLRIDYYRRLWQAEDDTSR